MAKPQNRNKEANRITSVFALYICSLFFLLVRRSLTVSEAHKERIEQIKQIHNASLVCFLITTYGRDVEITRSHRRPRATLVITNFVRDRDLRSRSSWASINERHCVAKPHNHERSSWSRPSVVVPKWLIANCIVFASLVAKPHYHDHSEATPHNHDRRSWWRTKFVVVIK